MVQSWKECHEGVRPPTKFCQLKKLHWLRICGVDSSCAWTTLKDRINKAYQPTAALRATCLARCRARPRSPARAPSITWGKDEQPSIPAFFNPYQPYHNPEKSWPSELIVIRLNITRSSFACTSTFEHVVFGPFQVMVESKHWQQPFCPNRLMLEGGSTSRPSQALLRSWPKESRRLPSEDAACPVGPCQQEARSSSTLWYIITYVCTYMSYRVKYFLIYSSNLFIYIYLCIHLYMCSFVIYLDLYFFYIFIFIFIFIFSRLYTVFIYLLMCASIIHNYTYNYI